MQSLPVFIYKGWIWGILITVCLTKILSISSKFIIQPLSYIGKYTLELYIGLDISKNILIYYMEPSTTYWILSIIGSIMVAILYNLTANHFQNPFYKI